MSLRPKILYPLFSSLNNIPGIGPRTTKLIEKITAPNLFGLCKHLPTNLLTRKRIIKLSFAEKDKFIILPVEVVSHKPSRRKNMPYKVVCLGGGVELELVFFNAKSDYLEEILPINKKKIVSGKIDFFRRKYQIIHPDYVVDSRNIGTIPSSEPIYPLTKGLTQRLLRKSIIWSLGQLPDLPEWVDTDLIEVQKWSSWRQSLIKLHNVNFHSDFYLSSSSRTRLAYDELLANQLAISIIRSDIKTHIGKKIISKKIIRNKVISLLPFKITDSQKKALEKIELEMADEKRMVHLLQGDVGSGKTIVALLSMLTVIEAGYQCALMAPTEILSKQHFLTFKKFLKDTDITVSLLAGNEKSSVRKKNLDDLSSGSSQVVIGTHSLFQEGVNFKNLGLVVIDEQQRFGVHQRYLLASKGKKTNVLVMTATPIPRTLTLASFGDINVSCLREKPVGRKDITTRVVPISRFNNIILAIKNKIKNNERVYWVCPLIEESEILNLVNVKKRFESLKNIFGSKIGLVHGKLKSEEKDLTMKKFVSGEISIIVSTTVIEVGVDIPEATVMVIEHAERFGLSQLHQLRGRVGRGNVQSLCVLVYDPPLTNTASTRLKVLRDTNDGFRIAEEDLRLRGSGEVLGIKQSGFPEFYFADLTAHQNLLENANNDAQKILKIDPGLTSKRGSALRHLLYLFEKDTAIKYLQSG